MDFSDFDYLPAKGGAKTVDDTYVNFAVAYNTIGFWSTLFNDILSVPVAGFANGLTKTATETSTNTFEWSLSFLANSVSYVGTLVAVKGSSTYTLELNAAPSSSPSSTFKYFDAVVHNDLSNVEWNIYKDDMGSVKVLDGTFTDDDVSGFQTLEYTYVLAAQTETSSSIEFNYTSGADYNSAYYMTMSTGMVDVEWDAALKAGRVKSLHHFVDEDWHCWNDVLGDITCAK
jgi:hypothetical protein